MSHSNPVPASHSIPKTCAHQDQRKNPADNPNRLVSDRAIAGVCWPCLQRKKRSGGRSHSGVAGKRGNTSDKQGAARLSDGLLSPIVTMTHRRANVQQVQEKCPIYYVQSNHDQRAGRYDEPHGAHYAQGTEIGVAPAHQRRHTQCHVNEYKRAAADQTAFQRSVAQNSRNFSLVKQCLRACHRPAQESRTGWNGHR